MEKVSINFEHYLANKIYPTALFLYGTYKEDGSPNFGLFCWFSYCWDSELAVMACIGGNKLTKDRIKAENIFSANLVTGPLLPLADYLGNTAGYDPRKMDISIQFERGAVLDVPVLKESPWVYELEVKQSLPLDGSDLFICRIRNTLIAEELSDQSKSEEEHIKTAAPVLWFGSGKYYAANPVTLGPTGDWKNIFRKG